MNKKDKLNKLKIKSKELKKRKDLRHEPNEHDINIANEHSKIVEISQYLAINNFTNFIKQNKNKILQISENITIRNDDGVVVIAKDDEWIEEVEWEELFI